MPIKLVAIYQMPEDQEIFNRHYTEIHTPIVRAIPGLLELRINKVSQHFIGDVRPYMIAEMVFANAESFQVAMASEENKKAGADIANFADGLVSVFVAEEFS